MSLLVTCLAVLLVRASALFADQDGSFDRLSTHIGPIDAVIASGKSIFVGTGASVVATLAVRTGQVSARFVLPEGLFILSLSRRSVLPFDFQRSRRPCRRNAYRRGFVERRRDCPVPL